MMIPRAANLNRSVKDISIRESFPQLLILITAAGRKGVDTYSKLLVVTH